MYLKPSPPPETARTPNLGWEQKVATVKQELESQEERLKEWERRLAQREQQLGERERQLADRERQLKEKEQQLAQLQAQVQLLQEQRNRTSSNSSMPPSKDSPTVPKRRRQKSSGRKRGGQPGHQGHSRVLYPIEECQSVSDHYPQTCPCCGGQLHGEDANPYRHQVIDIPPITPIVTEHRLHQRECQQCGRITRAQLPENVSPTGYGARVVAMVGLLSGLYRHSHRMVQSALQDLFCIQIALGTVNRIRDEVSEALKAPVAAAQEYVQQQPVVGADETSFAQGNADGGNPCDRMAWLWVAVTPLVSFFQILLSRSQEAAQTLLGKNFGGILSSDRHSSYNWVDLHRRQLCWAHLRRDFIQISERSGISRTWGEVLVKQQEKLFELWHQVRDGTLGRDQFLEAVTEIRQQLKATLQEAADSQIGDREQTPFAKTVRTCRKLLQVEPAMWLFVTTPGVEPTNNAAERAIRPAVLWRRTSFGSQSAAGSAFVARMLTVVTTLHSQRRSVLEYLTEAVRAAMSWSTRSLFTATIRSHRTPELACCLISPRQSPLHYPHTSPIPTPRVLTQAISPLNGYEKRATYAVTQIEFHS